jgi:3',5'-cyclic AMP phosphodiesterase CpdA
MRLKFVVVTDIHVGPEELYEGRQKKLSRFALPMLQELLTEIKRDIKPDFVVQLGDLIEDSAAPEEDELNYRSAISLFESLSVPVLHAIGNHETVNLSVGKLLSHMGRTTPYYSLDVGPVHCVVLMASTRAHTDIHIDAAQRNWLAADLRSTQKPTLVFLHHPLDEQNLHGSFWFEKYAEYCFVQERAQVRAILEESGKVVAVFNGHIHRNSLWTDAGIPYFSTQSFVENLHPGDGALCSQSYAIVDMDREQIRVEVRGKDPALYEVRSPFYLMPSSPESKCPA